jgi:hypothetical protein
VKREQEDEFKLWHEYQAWLLDVPEELTMQGIFEAIRERTPYLHRHKPTRRIFEESGVNKLLDMMCVLQEASRLEALDNLEVIYGQ